MNTFKFLCDLCVCVCVCVCVCEIQRAEENCKRDHVYSSQHLKWIKAFHQSCPKTKMCSRLRTTLMNLFDPLQMLTTVDRNGTPSCE